MTQTFSLSSAVLVVDEEGGQAAVEFTVRSGPYYGATIQLPVSLPGEESPDSLPQEHLRVLLVQKFGVNDAQYYLDNTTPSHRAQFLDGGGVIWDELVDDVEKVLDAKTS